MSKLHLTVSTDPSTNVTIRVAARTMQKRGEIIDAITEKTLYMLEPGHPSVDFVIASQGTLYMIQVSTLTYSAHRTKSASVRLKYGKTTVLHHYSVKK